MKVQKTITLEHEIYEKLGKEVNASKLINDLLVQHYNYKKAEDLSIEELQRQLDIINLKEKHAKELEVLNGTIK